MDRRSFLLDSSAVFSLLEDEAGADRVEDLLRAEKVYLPWVALLEVHYVSRQERGEDVANGRLALLKTLPAEIIWEHDEPALLLASRFKAQNRLSLADALIAGLASQRNAVLVHKDPEFEALN
ncbi:MAG TPA: PIN domain-containing protein, partial [Thermoanaerobaculia bacterium]